MELDRFTIGKELLCSHAQTSAKVADVQAGEEVVLDSHQTSTLDAFLVGPDLLRPDEEPPCPALARSIRHDVADVGR